MLVNYGWNIFECRVSVKWMIVYIIYDFIFVLKIRDENKNNDENKAFNSKEKKLL